MLCGRTCCGSPLVILGPSLGRFGLAWGISQLAVCRHQQPEGAAGKFEVFRIHCIVGLYVLCSLVPIMYLRFLLQQRYIDQSCTNNEIIFPVVTLLWLSISTGILQLVQLQCLSHSTTGVARSLELHWLQKASANINPFNPLQSSYKYPTACNVTKLPICDLSK